MSHSAQSQPTRECAIRSPRIAIVGLVAAAAFLIGASSASAFISTLAKVGDAYSKVNACLENQKVGLDCLAGTEDAVRELHKKVDALQKTIDANHGQVITRFDQVEKLLNKQNLSRYGLVLRGLDINGATALTAWDAVLTCMDTSISGGATCGAYIGGSSTEAPQPTVDAINDTLVYMQREISNLPTDIGLTASFYTGTKASGGRDGVAYWSWWSSLREQDMAVGVDRESNPHTPIITTALAQITRQSTTYYANIFQQYGYLMVLGAQVRQDAKLAASYQATVDRIITGPGRPVPGRPVGEKPVMEVVKQYLLPGLAERTMIVLHKGKALKVSAGHKLDRPLDYATIATVAAEINSKYNGSKLPFGGVDRFIDAFPNSIGEGGWYVVEQRVHHKKTVIEKGALNISKITFTELADSGSMCNTKVRIWGGIPGWEEGQETGMGMYSDLPYYGFEKSYKRYVTGQANYDWERYTFRTDRAFYKFGFGSWITCTKDAPGTQRVMSVKPEMLGEMLG